MRNRNYRLKMLKKSWITNAVFLIMSTTAISQNVNSNAIIIQNQPVLEKEKYIIEYRTEYKDRPSAKRVARRLSAPVCLQGYLWIYPQDLGKHSSTPYSIINQINEQGNYGRDDWRIPSPEELHLMESCADECGLGEDMYMSTTNSGVVRLVSTGLSVREKNAIIINRNIDDEINKREREIREHNQIVAYQKKILASGEAILIGNLIWKVKNEGALRPKDKGTSSEKYNSNVNWRVPTEKEFKDLIKKAINLEGQYIYGNLTIPSGNYRIVKRDGRLGNFLIESWMTGDGKNCLHRLVQDKVY